MIKKKKLTTKIDFVFNEQEDMPELTIELSRKTKKTSKHITIIEQKKKIEDVSTKLF
jgi:hypothetical protein